LSRLIEAELLHERRLNDWYKLETSDKSAKTAQPSRVSLSKFWFTIYVIFSVAFLGFYGCIELYNHRQNRAREEAWRRPERENIIRNNANADDMMVAARRRDIHDESRRFEHEPFIDTLKYLNSSFNFYIDDEDSVFLQLYSRKIKIIENNLRIFFTSSIIEEYTENSFKNSPIGEAAKDYNSPALTSDITHCLYRAIVFVKEAYENSPTKRNEQIELFTQCFTFVLRQPVSFQIEYFTSWTRDNLQAYGDRQTGFAQSCLRGMAERIYMTLTTTARFFVDRVPEYLFYSILFF